MTEMPSTTPNDGPAAVQLTHRQILLIFSGLMLGMFLSALDQTIVSAALPTIVGDLGGLNKLTWVVTSYMLTSTVTILLWGKLSDIYGRKVMFQSSIGLFLAASALVGLSPNMLFLVLARGLQGIGAGGIMSLAFAIIGDILSPRERGKYMGLMGSVFVVSMVVGPFLGGLIVDHLHLFGVAPWRWIFYINLPIGIPALFLTGMVLRLPFHRRHSSIDWLGFALQALGAAAIILAMTWGGQPAPWDASTTLAWGSPTIVGLLAGGILLLAGFVWAEMRAASPLLPMHLFRSRSVSVASAVSFIVGAAMFGGFVFLPTYLQVSTGTSATVSGFLLLPMMAGMFPAMTGSGIIITRTGRYKWWPMLGLPVGTVGMLVLSTLTPNTPWAILVLGMFLLGAGIGMTMQVMVLAVQNSVEMKDIGAGTASNTFIRSLGGVFGVGVFGAIFADRVRQTMADVARIAAQNGIDIRSLGGSLQASPGQIHDLPAAVRDPITAGVASAVAHVFLYAAPVMALGFLIVLFLKEVPLRSSRNVGGGTGTPVSGGTPATPAASGPQPRHAAATNGNGAGNGHAFAPAAPLVDIRYKPLPPRAMAVMGNRRYTHEDIQRAVDALPGGRS